MVSLLIIFWALQHLVVTFFFPPLVVELPERGTDCKKESMFSWLEDETAGSDKAKINCRLKSQAQHA